MSRSLWRNGLTTALAIGTMLSASLGIGAEPPASNASQKTTLDRGAQANDAEQDRILTYLVRFYGP